MKLNFCSILLISSLFISLSALAKTDSSSVDKGSFYIKAGAGLCSSDWVMSVVYFQPKEAFSQPNIVYSGSLQYCVGKDIAISVAGFYSQGAYKSTVGSVYDQLGINDQIEHKVTNYRTNYKVIGAAAECQVIYDRLYQSSMILYCSGGLGYAFGTGTRESVEVKYMPGSNIPSYSVGRFDKTKDIAKAHVTLVGLRGGKNLCWYAELGYGYKGILNAGVAVKL